jgi:ribosomal-protein-alanine N-acetyltransferase
MILESERLVFRFFENNDKKFLIELLNNENVSRLMDNVPFPYLEKHADWWIEIGSKKKYQFALILKKSSTLIGSLKISLKGEIGCWIGEQYFNQNFATEAIERIKKFAFEELEINKLWASTKENNIASFNLMEKTGFTRVDDRPYYVEGIGDTKIRPHFELTK